MRSAILSLLPSSIRDSQVTFVTVTVVFVTITVLIGIVLTKIEVVLSYKGSALGSLLVYM